jgi:small subunit ribosomal protein S1
MPEQNDPVSPQVTDSVEQTAVEQTADEETTVEAAAVEAAAVEDTATEQANAEQAAAEVAAAADDTAEQSAAEATATDETASVSTETETASPVVPVEPIPVQPSHQAESSAAAAPEGAESETASPVVPVEPIPIQPTHQAESGEAAAAASEATSPEMTSPETAAPEAKAAGDGEAESTEGGGEDFASALAEFEAGKGDADKSGPKPGDRIKGKIISIGETNAFVDLGTKAEGQVELSELRDDDGNLTAEIGDEIDAVVRGRDDNGGYLLSIKLGQGQKALEEIRLAHEQGLPIDGIVTSVNKGGVEVKVAGLRGFCPMSQLDLRYVEDPNQFIQQTLSFRVTQFEESPAKGRRPNIVLSRRSLLEEEASALAANTRQKLEIGAVLEGTVSSLTDYGAFIDLGGMDGLLHVSEIDHVRVAHPKDALQVGQMVQVKVIKIESSKDPKRSERISLSRRALAPDPWKDVASKLQEGSSVPGQVVRLEAFGAFVNLAPGVDGLVHISELGADRRIGHPKEVVEVGQEVEVRVLRVDLGQKRVSLSMAPEGQSRGGGGGGGGGEGRSEGRGRGGGGGGGRGRDNFGERRRPSSGPPQVITSTGGGTFGAMADFFKRAQDEVEEGN